MDEQSDRRPEGQTGETTLSAAAASGSAPPGADDPTEPAALVDVPLGPFALYEAEKHWRAGRAKAVMSWLQAAIEGLPSDREECRRVWLLLYPGERLTAGIEMLTWGLLRRKSDLGSIVCQRMFDLLSISFERLGQINERIGNAESFLFFQGPRSLGFEQLAFALDQAGDWRGAAWAAEKALAADDRGTTALDGPKQHLKALIRRGTVRRLALSLRKARHKGRRLVTRYVSSGKNGASPSCHDQAAVRGAGGSGVTDENSTPVFLCGHPKSGTTLLLSLLDWHHELLVFPEETAFFLRFRRRNEQNRWLAAGLQPALTDRRLQNLGAGQVDDGGGHRNYSGFDAEDFFFQVRLQWDKLLSNSRRDVGIVLESIVRGYGKVAGPTNPRYWIEKTPLNEEFLGSALKMWPNVRAIYIVRNPVDNYYSYRVKQQRRQRELDVSDFCHGWRRSLSHWHKFAVRHPGQGLMLRYEDLAANPDQQMRHVAEFLGIQWSDTLLRPTRWGRPWHGNSQHFEHLDGVSSAVVGIGRQGIDTETVREITGLCKSEIKRYYADEIGHRVTAAD